MIEIFLDDFQIHSNTDNTLKRAIHRIQGLETPDIRFAKYDRPGEDGAEIANVLYGGRPITLEGTVWGESSSAYEQNRRAIQGMTLLTRDSNSRPNRKTLKFKTLDNLELQTEVNIRDIKMEIEDVLSSKLFIDLYSPKFILESQGTKQVTVDIIGGGGATYPVIYPVTYGAESGTIGSVNNIGNARAFPLIYIIGPITNPLIQNVTTGKFMRLNLTLLAGEQVIITTYPNNKSIIKNGNQSMISTKSDNSRFWWLNPGINIITLRSGLSSDTGQAQIVWRDSYLGA